MPEKQESKKYKYYMVIQEGISPYFNVIMFFVSSLVSLLVILYIQPQVADPYISRALDRLLECYVLAVY